MKILIINYAYWITGGPERYLFNLKKQLEKNGHHVIPFSMNCKENFDTPYSKYFISSINPDDSWYFTRKKWDIQTSFKQIKRLFFSNEVKKNLSSLIEVENPDIAYVLLFHRKLSPSVLTTCASHKIPIVMRISDYLLMCPKVTFYRDGHICELCKKNKFFSIRYKCIKNSLTASILWYIADKFHHLTRIYHSVNAYVLTNPFMGKKMCEYGYNGNHNVIESFSDNNEKYQKKHHEKFKKKQFCYIGNIFEHKGVDLLLDAFFKFRKAYPDYKLIIMGNDFDHIIEKMRVTHNEFFKNVKYCTHSNKSEVLETLSNSLFSFAPVKWYENLPNSIIESFSVGTPVIATDIGSIHYMVKNKFNGFTFKYGDIQDLTEKMIEAISTDSKKYYRMQQNCTNEIRSKYDKKIHYHKLMNLFQTTIHDHNQTVRNLQKKVKS